MSNIRLIGNRKYPSIPTVGGDPASHTMALEAIRDAIQTHERRGRDPLNSFLRLFEMIDLGLVRREGDALVLTFDPAQVGAGGGGGGAVDSVNGQTGTVVLALDDIDDVDAAAPSVGDVLTFDGADWVPQAPAAPAADVWTNVVTQPFSANTTGFASNTSGSWAISGGVLEQSSNTTSGAVFRYTTTVPYTALRMRCEMRALSTGSPSTSQLVGFFMGPVLPSSTPTSCINFTLRVDSGTKRFAWEEFGVGSIYNPMFNWSLDTWYAVEIIIIGNRVTISVDGVLIGSFASMNAFFVAYENFGLFTYGTLASFRNFTIDRAFI